MKDPERDAGFERLVARAVHGGDTAEDCPDAETMAAWSDNVLRGQERSRVEAHVSTCARCQMQLAAMARMAESDEDRAAESRGVRFARGGWWLVPVAGAVAAAGLWFIVQPAPVVPPPPSAKQAQAPAPHEPPPPMRDEGQSTATDAVARPPRIRAQEQRSAAGAVAGSAPPAPAQPVPAPPAPSASPAPMAARVEERTEMSAARAANAGAIAGLKVVRTEDGRVTWDPKSSPLLAQVTAAASPVPGVIWLAGRAGLVLLTADGQSWRRLAFPEVIDLTAISASDATAAAVTAADGRVFVTSDGGTTWVSR